MIEITPEIEDAYVKAAYADHEQITVGVTAGLQAAFAAYEQAQQRPDRECGAIGPDGTTCNREPDHEPPHAAPTYGLSCW